MQRLLDFWKGLEYSGSTVGLHGLPAGFENSLALFDLEGDKLTLMLLRGEMI